mgnify:CR=1 FL=1
MLFYFNFRGNLLFFASKTEIHKQERAKKGSKNRIIPKIHYLCGFCGFGLRDTLPRLHRYSVVSHYCLRVALFRFVPVAVLYFNNLSDTLRGVVNVFYNIAVAVLCYCQRVAGVDIYKTIARNG